MSGLELLEHRIRRTALQEAAIAVVVLGVAGVVLAAAAFRARTQFDAKTMVVGGFGLVFLWVTWIFVQNARELWTPQDARVWLQLTGDAKEVAWAHRTQGSVNAVKIYFLDGKLCTLYAGKKDGEALLAFVQDRAPHALIGFGADQQKAYLERVRARPSSH